MILYRYFWICQPSCRIFFTRGKILFPALPACAGRAGKTRSAVEDLPVDRDRNDLPWQELSARAQRLPRRVLELSVDALRPNPNQPRVEFDEDSLRALSDSIRRYGILQPLTVRRTDEGYELIAGERRLRAAKLAGLREVPCLLARSSEEESALLALVENLQRRDLHYLEEAAAIARLISSYGLCEAQAAEKLGKSQSAVANKLRLLRLSPDCTRLLLSLIHI